MDQTAHASGRTDLLVPYGGERLSAWLYRPTGLPDDAPLTGPDAVRRPIVVMAHGLGGRKDMGLDPFARRFADAGLWVLVFDYRGFGPSSGTPRQVVSRRRQLLDWDAAVRYAGRLPGVDPERVAVWGSSYGGGLVIDVIRRNPHLAAGVAQCPFTDGIASALAGNPFTMLRLGLHGFLDLAGALLRREPHLVPVAAAPGKLGFLTSRDALQYQRLQPAERADRPELIAARFAFAVLVQRPGKRIGDSRVPLQLNVCERDLEAPARATLRHARNTDAEVHRYPCGHFEIYLDDGFEQVVADQLAFFRRHLLNSSPVAG